PQAVHDWGLPQSAGLHDDLALLQGLGDVRNLRWDERRGQLNSREWQAARRAAEWLRQLPAIDELLRRLGRRDHAATPPPAAAPEAREAPRAQLGLRAVTTVLADAPGEITGIRFSARPERMLGSGAVMRREP